MKGRYNRFLGRIIALCLVLCFTCTIVPQPLQASDEVKEEAQEEKKGSLLGSMLRLGGAFAATTAIKGLFGMAPGYLTTLIPTLGPTMAVPMLIGAGLLEGAISLSIFTLIMDQKDRRYLIRAFLMASIVSVAATFFLSGLMAPWAVTVLSNVLRLGLFSLLTRPPNKDLTEHLVDEVKAVVGKDTTDKVETEEGVELSAKELEELRKQAYQDYLAAADLDGRAEAHTRFKKYTDLLSKLRQEAAPAAQ